MSPTMVREGLLDCQVCVPKGWTDEQAIEFANKAYPAGTTNGWQIVREGSKWLAGDPERVPCEEDPDNVHILMEI